MWQVRAGTNGTDRQSLWLLMNQKSDVEKGWSIVNRPSTIIIRMNS
jgi:hypothetical protein